MVKTGYIYIQTATTSLTKIFLFSNLLQCIGIL